MVVGGAEQIECVYRKLSELSVYICSQEKRVVSLVAFNYTHGWHRLHPLISMRWVFIKRVETTRRWYLSAIPVGAHDNKFKFRNNYYRFVSSY